jgi:hypothetical protein
MIVALGRPLGRRDVCRNFNECRRGFLLNDNTYVGHFTFHGIDVGRWAENQCLYGGAPLETPGCQDSYCRAHGDPDCGIGGQSGPDLCTAGGCEGVRNVLVEDVEVAALTTQTAVWMPLNVPTHRPVSRRICRHPFAHSSDVVLVRQTELSFGSHCAQPPGNQSCSNVTFRRIVSGGTWADGVNVHGEHDNVRVEQSVISNTGDDGASPEPELDVG